MDQLDFEAFQWSVSFREYVAERVTPAVSDHFMSLLAMPRPLCEKLAQHPTFYKLGIAGNDGGTDCFSSLNRE